MIKTILKEVKQYKSASIQAPIFTVGEVVLELLIPYFMGEMIDRGISQNNMSAVYKFGGIMLILAVLSLFCGVYKGILAAKASTGLACNLREAMYRKVQTYSFSNIDKYSTAGLVTRLTTDVNNVQNSYQMFLSMCMRAPSTLIISMFLAFSINVKLTLIFVVAILFLALALICIAMLAMPIFSKVFKQYDDLNRSVQENVSAIRVVKAFVRGDYENTKFQEASNKISSLFKKAEIRLSVNGPIMSLTVDGCILLLSFLGAKMIAGGQLTTGNLTKLLSYVLSILISLMMLSIIFVMLTMSIASMKRITEVLNEVPDIQNAENPVMSVASGSVDFENVSFAYKKREMADDEPDMPFVRKKKKEVPEKEYVPRNVLEGINFSVKSGETIGIIGGTGSSKSSLVNLISRLYDVNGGCVKVGGRDVREYDIETLRNEVAVVLQKNTLFSGSILDNLRWGNPDATEEECERVCKLACADEFIDKMPDRYHTHIEQGGNNVSGGQKQRLCIARALLKKPKILILDDSTSAVDTATDAKIRKAFREEIPNTTKFIIAQRISSVMDADRILVLENGHLNGFDTHENLLKTNTIYREVYEGQTQGGGDFDEGGEG